MTTALARRPHPLIVLARHRFDPDQPRDPHSGKWSHVGAILHDVIHTAHGDITATHHPEGTHIRSGDSDSGPLDRKATLYLTDHLGAIGYDDRASGGKYPRVNSVHTYDRHSGKVTAYAGVHQPAHDRGELELFNNEHRHALTTSDADALGAAMVRASNAHRAVADTGPVDVWPQDHDHAVIRVHRENDGPAEVHLTKAQMDRLNTAVRRADERGTETRVRTKSGPVTVRRAGQWTSHPTGFEDGEEPPESGPLEIVPDDGSWRIGWHSDNGAVPNALDEVGHDGLGAFEEWRGVGFNNSARRTGRPRAEFDPAEGRDDHGRWSSLGAHVAHEIHKLGDHELHVEAHHEHTPPGHVTIRHGDRSVTLNDREQRDLLRHLHSSEPEVYGSRMTGVAPAPPKHDVLYRVGHGGHDDEGNSTAHTLTVAGHGDDFDSIDHAPRLPMNDQQREHLASSITRVSEARRIDTGNGLLDMFATPDDHIGLRMSDDHGNPTEVTFDEKDWTKLKGGLNVLFEGFDDSGKNPDAEVNEMTVKTSHGPVHLRWRGGRDPKGGPTPDSSLTIIPEDGPWSVAVSGSHISDFLERAGWLEAATGINQ